MKGRLIVVSGPSGVGKGTILAKVFEKSTLPLTMSISATTRTPRPHEQDGVHYWFLSKEDFHQRIQGDEFLEYFEVFANGHMYGTLKNDLQKLLDQGRWVVLEIDIQGTNKALESYPDAITIFIEPPNAEILKERLIKRGTENDAKMQERLNRAAEELAYAEKYKHRIVNDDLNAAVNQFCEILNIYAHGEEKNL